MSSRREVTDEILLLRVREIYDHVLKDFREPWLNRKCLFRVSDAHPVGRRGSGEGTLHFSHPDHGLEVFEGTYT